MANERSYDIAIIGGGPVALSTAHEAAKADQSVVALEQYNFFNQLLNIEINWAGSSGDLPRMFRTMYTEGFMADLAHECMGLWDDLETEAEKRLRWMTGLLNFGNPNYDERGPEGTLLGPIKNLKRLGMEMARGLRFQVRMWFHFQNHLPTGRSQLFYGYPVLPWGPPDLARITVDTATRRIADPDERNKCGTSKEDIANTRSFVQRFMKGVNPSIPVFESVCLQGNVFDNMFVLDHLPTQYLQGGDPGSVVLFTAGWAMKFAPLIGRALKELSVEGRSKYARVEFAINREDDTGKGLIEEF